MIDEAHFTMVKGFLSYLSLKVCLSTANSGRDAVKRTLNSINPTRFKISQFDVGENILSSSPTSNREILPPEEQCMASKVSAPTWWIMMMCADWK